MHMPAILDINCKSSIISSFLHYIASNYNSKVGSKYDSDNRTALIRQQVEKTVVIKGEVMSRKAVRKSGNMYIRVKLVIEVKGNQQ